MLNIPIRALRLSVILAAVLVAGGLAGGGAMAQGKPENTGKPGFAGKADKAEKGERGRSDAALEHAKERGQGEKKGIGKRDEKSAKSADGEAGKLDKDKKAKKEKKAKSEKTAKKDKTAKSKSEDDGTAEGEKKTE